MSFEILTVGYRSESNGGLTVGAIVHAHLGPVASVVNWRGLRRQVTGQSINILTGGFYLEIVTNSITANHKVQKDQTEGKEAQEHSGALLVTQWQLGGNQKKKEKALWSFISWKY